MKWPATEPGSIGGLMNRLRMLLVAAALMAGGSALASAQSWDHDDHDRGRWRDRDHRFDRDRRDRDDRGYFGDRDDRRFVDRDDYRFFDHDGPRYVGERRWFNGYYWTWDGYRWCRRDRGV